MSYEPSPSMLLRPGKKPWNRDTVTKPGDTKRQNENWGQEVVATHNRLSPFVVQRQHFLLVLTTMPLSPLLHLSSGLRLRLRLCLYTYFGSRVDGPMPFVRPLPVGFNQVLRISMAINSATTVSPLIAFQKCTFCVRR